MKKQLLSLALLSVAWLAGGSAWAQHSGDHSYTNGICTIDGCTDKYQPATYNDGWYELRNAGNIEWMSKVIQDNKSANDKAYAQSKFKMMNDIDFTDVTHTKIGQSETYKFDGTFDGQGYRITNLVMNEPSNTRIGFFGYCRGEFTVIRNIIIDKTCSFKGKECVAALIGTFQKAVTDKYPTIENCVNEANVTATDKSAAAFVGGKPSNDDMPRLFITNCINTGDIKVEASVSGNDCAAAIVANYNCGSGKGGNSTLTNCVNTGTVSPANGDQTLFTGSYRSYVNCYNVKTGKMNNSSTAIEWSTANPIGNGELCYKLNVSTDAGTAYYQTIGTDEYPLPFSSHQQVRQANANNFTNLTVSEGTVQLGSAANLIKFSQEVNAGNTTMNAAMTSDIDVSTGGYEPIGTDTKKYAGTFDGGGHKVNLNIDANAYGQGFIGVGQGGLTVRNLIVTGKVKNDGSKTGGIVAEVHGGTGTVTIANCGNEAKIEGAGGETAAIVANNWGGTCTLNITNVYNIGDVSGSGDVASICACQANGSSVFTNVYNSGTVTGDAGGKFVRTSWGTYTRCYSTSLSASDNASIIETNSTEITSGKLCYLLNGTDDGTTWTQTIGSGNYPIPFSTQQTVHQASTDSYTNLSVLGGTVQLSSSANLIKFSQEVNAGNTDMDAELTADINMSTGGYSPTGTTDNKYTGTFDGKGHIVTLNITSDQEFQGLIGCATDGAEIKNVITRGSVSGSGRCAGVLGGSQGSGSISITNCGNEANITTTNQNAGGILGCNQGGNVTYTIENCYNAGTIIGGKESAGLSGWLGKNAIVTNCYNIGSVTGIETKDGKTYSFARWDVGYDATFTNCYNVLSGYSPTGLTNSYSSDNVSSGELCYLLNDDQSNIVWRQMLDTDAHPVLDSSKPNVYKLTVGQYGWASFVPEVNIPALPDGVTAYVGQNNGNSLHLEAVTALPADNAFIVKATKGDYYYNNTTESITLSEENDLEFYTADHTADGSQYCLSNKASGVGFYKVNSGVTIPARKAYLAVSAGPGTKEFFGFDDDDATGISNLNVNDNLSEGTIYNVAGQRINKMQKGINIVNGKKVMY